MEVPETRFVRSGDVHIAHVCGSWQSNVERRWDRGAHALKGMPGEWRLFAVRNS